MVRFTKELKDIERPGFFEAVFWSMLVVNLVGIVCVIPLSTLIATQHIVIVLLVVGPLFAAFRASQRQTLLIALYAMIWAVVIGLVHHSLFSDEHLARLLMIVVGSVFAVALARLRERNERSNAQLNAILDSVPFGLGFLSNGFRFIRVNDAYAQMGGRQQQEYLGQLSRDLFPQLQAETASRLDALMRQAFNGAAMVSEQFTEFGDNHQLDHAWRVSFFPVQDKLGQKLGLGSIAEDITEQVRRERQHQRADARARFLTKASVELTRSIEYSDILVKICDLLAVEVVDACMLDIVEGSYLTRRAGANHDRAIEQTLYDIQRPKITRRVDEPSYLTDALRSEQALLINPLTTSDLCDLLNSDDQEQISQLDFHSAMVVPLITSGRSLGVLTLVYDQKRAPFTQQDLSYGEEVASHIAALIEQARLYRDSLRLAKALQENLLPPTLPAIPGLELAARYHAVGEGNEIGGDFYDVFPIGAGRWAIVIGDVEGKGAEATTLVAMAHYTLRMVALQTSSPAQMLARLNAEIIRQRDESPFCSVALLIVEQDATGIAVTAASGGHPYPLIKRHNGHVETLTSSGMLVGISPIFEISDVTTHLDRGDLMIVYTDGVSDVRPNGQMLGQAGLTELIEQCQTREPEELAGFLEQTVMDYQGGQNSDDLALVVLSVPYKDPVYLNQRFPAQPQSIGEVRSLLDTACQTRQDIPGYDLQLMASEIAANAVLYGRYDLIGEVSIEASIAVSENRVRCEITNRGQPFLQEASDPGPEATGGRGLLIVDHLATRWGQEASPGGKTKVWFELDLNEGQDQLAIESSRPVSDDDDLLAAFNQLEDLTDWE